MCSYRVLIFFIYSTADMKVCLVTIAIGETYYTKFLHIFMRSQFEYAKRMGYDYKIINKSIGDVQTPATISLEKQLLCSQSWAQDYDFLIFLDADILVSRDAPPIHILCKDTDKIGVVDEMCQPTREERSALQIRNGWEKTATEYYSLCQLDLNTEYIYNTGVLVFQPKKHAEFCRMIYVKYKERQKTHPRKYHYEQAVANYEYQTADMCLSLDSKWNAVWSLHKETTYRGVLADFMKENYFVHLAGNFDYQSAYEWSKSQSW